MRPGYDHNYYLCVGPSMYNYVCHQLFEIFYGLTARKSQIAIFERCLQSLASLLSIDCYGHGVSNSYRRPHGVTVIGVLHQATTRERYEPKRVTSLHYIGYVFIRTLVYCFLHVLFLRSTCCLTHSCCYSSHSFPLSEVH